MVQITRDIILEKELFWKLKKEIDYDERTENFLDYLKKEKTSFDQPRPLNQMLGATVALIAMIVLIFYSATLFVESVLEFLNGILVGSADFQTEMFSILVIATFLASILGQILVIAYILFRYFLTNDKWSNYHDQALALFERLEKAGLLDMYIKFEKEVKCFKLEKISIDFQFEWMFPFIFEAFPPLLFELLLVSFLLPFSVATFVSIIIAILNSSWLDFVVLGVLMLVIILGFYSSLKSIINSWRKYHWIRNSMIDKQKAIIHGLILNEEDDLFILRNEHNLTRLESMKQFPLPTIIRFSALIPLFGSFLGYLVGIAFLL